MKHIYTKDDTPTLETYGGKAYALTLLSKEFDIPQWIVLSPEFLDECNEQEFLSYIQTQFDGITHFAVRSSAREEDGEAHSFAGLLESYLNVTQEDLLQNIQKVFTSNESERVRSYCQTQHIALPSKPSVIVQAMLHPSSAGVAFSSDPLTSDRKVVIVSAVHGLGDKLVDGEVTGDRYSVKNSVIYKNLDSDKAVLSDTEILAVADLAKKSEAYFSHPQDIEWAIEDKKLYLLQSRPISSIKKVLEGEERLWDNSNIVESYSGVTTPLTYSFARYVYEEVYREFCKVLRVPKIRVTQNNHAFKTLLGLLNGQIYYNLLSWNRILALLPGFKFNRHFMEQMMGVKEGLPQKIVDELEAASSGSKFFDALGLVRTLGSLIYQQIIIEKTIKKFYKRLDDALISSSELQDKNVDELVSHYRNLEAQLLDKWDAPLINDFLAMIYFGVLGKLCVKWLDADEYLQNDLIIDNSEIISAQPAKRIIQMADILRNEGKSAINLFATGSEDTIEQYLENHKELKSALHSYLELFGDRTLEELKLESLTLEDDATTLYRAIAAMAMREKSEIKNSNQKEEAESLIQKKLKDSKIKIFIMNFVLKNARSRVSARENLRFERTRLFGHIRRIFLRIAHHFKEAGIIKNVRDIFYLEVNEIFGYIEGTTTTQNLQALIDLRRSEFEHFKEETISSRFHTYGAVNYNNSFKSTELSQRKKSDDANSLHGFGCCAGTLTAKVRVIENPQDALIQEGEILVAKQTDPGWIMLFPASAGILVERGSMLSHSAIVAREMNIPAIVGIDNLLERLRTGDVVRMNGATGEIVKIESSQNNV
jgi:pyruvate,water dikinase